jgi:hypothetical protein
MHCHAIRWLISTKNLCKIVRRHSHSRSSCAIQAIVNMHESALLLFFAFKPSKDTIQAMSISMLFCPN